jgi:hypothetical protein
MATNEQPDPRPSVPKAFAAEAAALERYAERRRSGAPAPKAKLDPRDKSGSCAIAPYHPDARVWLATLDAACGTMEPAFRDRLLGQLPLPAHRNV